MRKTILERVDYNGKKIGDRRSNQKKEISNRS